MTAKLFSDAMNEIGAKYVEEALYYERSKKRSFFAETAKRAAAVLLAASLLFAAGVVVSVPVAAHKEHAVLLPLPISCHSIRSLPCRTVTH